MTKQELEDQIEELENEIESLKSKLSDLKDCEKAFIKLEERISNSIEPDGTLEMQYKIEAFKENHERFTSAEFEKLMKSYTR